MSSSCLVVAFYAIPCRKTQETWECCFERCSTISSANRYYLLYIQVTMKHMKHWIIKNPSPSIAFQCLNACTRKPKVCDINRCIHWTANQNSVIAWEQTIGGLIFEADSKMPRSSWKWGAVLPLPYLVIHTYSSSLQIWIHLGMVQTFR